ncbi:hypothetical protein [Melittangium boletus]|uniref:hypothetical protein n=1 Tax=Melittangium boletus TaxID=83453 RepID=UPI003DA232E7
MTRHILGWGLALVLGASCDSEQPPIGCPVQSLEWSAVYKPKPGNTCPVKAAELLGVQKFTTPAYDEQLSIKPQTLEDLDGRDPSRAPYSLGKLAKASNAEGFCAATDMAVAEKHAPAVIAGDDIPFQPAKDIVYRWSNVQVLAIPRAPGTQLVADLEYTEDGCTAQYEVWAMWPGDVECGNEDGAPDDSLCASAGSINPDFATVCEPTLLRCVPAKRPPSLK